jgi:DNA repair protein RecO
MGLIESEGFILRTHKLAEADKIVVCLTHKCGVIRGVARGARRLKSRFGASLEPFTLVTLSLFEREGKELMSLRQAEIRQSYFHLSLNTEVIASLEYLSELIIEFTPPHEPDTKLLRMVGACLEAISADPTLLQEVIRYFEFWILKLSGFLAPPEKCANCEVRLAARTPEIVVAYASRGGAFNCHECYGYDAIPVSGEVLERLIAMQKMAPGAWSKSGVRYSLNIGLEISKILKRNIASALDRTPRGQTTGLDSSPLFLNQTY